MDIRTCINPLDFESHRFQAPSRLVLSSSAHSINVCRCYIGRNGAC